MIGCGISREDLSRMQAFGCMGGDGSGYANLSIEELEAAVVKLLKPNRISHVLGCRDTAVELAKLWGADETDAARAALLHDITKALGPDLQLELCKTYQVKPDRFSQENPKTLLALTGSLVAQHIFRENPAVVNAIESHTTGKADMTLLEKIIYVADYMEPNRDFEGVQQLRRLAYSNMDEAVMLGLSMTLDMLRQQGREVSAKSREAMEFLMKKERYDVNSKTGSL